MDVFPLQVRPAEIGVIADRGVLHVDHEAVRPPEVGQRVELAVDGGIALDDAEQGRLEFIELHLAQIDRLVDLEVPLHGADAVLRGLDEIVAGAAGRPELRDHLLVVRERDLDFDAGLLGERRDQIRWNIIGPGQDA